MINPSAQTLDQSYVKDYETLYRESMANPETFWGNIARELLWFKPWNKVLEWNFPYGRWFTGGQCNIVYNALDRWQKTEVKNKLAYIWVGQDHTIRTFTYGQLNEAVCRAGNALKSLGVKKGDRVSIYLPRIPEQMISMLACAKIGAVHSVVFSGFSSEALKNRIIDAEAKILITCDAYPYGKKVIECKKNADEAIKDLPQIEHVIVVNRLTTSNKSEDINFRATGEVRTTTKSEEHAPWSGENSVSSFQKDSRKPDRDLWWHELMAKQDTICGTAIMESTDPAFILYTSGSTGKPKGVIHSHGGYMVGTYITLKWVFNIAPDDVWFCTADCGWITGHSYIVYAPLMNGVTTLIYEGTPDYPDPGIWWKLVQEYKVTKFYTAPTAIRALMRLGETWPKKYDLSSLKILGSVGEPINPEAWLWYYKYIGREQCPVMDTWWQTETGMFMVTPQPSVPLKPGSAFKPFPGVVADVVDDQGKSAPANKEGYLVIKTPWPAMLQDIYKNPARYKETYFEKIPGVYLSGDMAKKDEDGYFWIIGRSDDVIKVSGHRLGSAEIESAFVAHPAVAEAAAIGKPDEIKGEKIKVFVILKQGQQPSDQLKTELVQQVRKLIGPIATPDEIDFVDKLPKTRSGKIMRRVLKAQELGQPLGDTSTLES